jgi:hypothetical protein
METKKLPVRKPEDADSLVSVVTEILVYVRFTYYPYVQTVKKVQVSDSSNAL